MNAEQSRLVKIASTKDADGQEWRLRMEIWMFFKNKHATQLARRNALTYLDKSYER